MVRILSIFLLIVVSYTLGCQRDESKNQQPKKPQFRDGEIHFYNSLPITKLPIQSNGVKLMIPSNIVSHVSTWNGKNETYEGNIFLEFGKLKEFSLIPDEQRYIDIFIQNSSLKYWGESRLKNMLSAETNYGSLTRLGDRDRLGFEAYITPNGFEYLTRKRLDGETDLVWCHSWKDFPHPSCQYEVMYRRLHVTILFKGDYLPQWDILRNNVFNQLDKFIEIEK